MERKTQNTNITVAKPQRSMIAEITKDYKKNKVVILMMLPVVLWYITFNYIPMFGIVIAFQKFSVVKGILGSAWVGFDNFVNFFNSFYAWRVIRNTFIISFYQLLFGFPMPIIFALLLNEVKSNMFRRTVQTVTYLPHFVSMVVMCGIIVDFFSYNNGVVNDIISFFGGERISFLLKPEYFRTVYVGSGIWQNMGWNSIIYLAALAGIDSQLYEAASIDGAGRFRQFLNVTLPGITSTIIVLLILNIGRIMSMGAEKVILLYNENTYETADMISSFVYRRGIIYSDYSFSTAVGLFNSVINLILMVSANYISRKFSENSLW